MRVAVISAVLPMLFASHAATAQVTGMVTPTSIIGATTPFGMGPAPAAAPTGIPRFHRPNGET